MCARLSARAYSGSGSGQYPALALDGRPNEVVEGALGQQVVHVNFRALPPRRTGCGNRVDGWVERGQKEPRVGSGGGRRELCGRL